MRTTGQWHEFGAGKRARQGLPMRKVDMPVVAPVQHEHGAAHRLRVVCDVERAHPFERAGDHLPVGRQALQPVEFEQARRRPGAKQAHPEYVPEGLAPLMPAAAGQRREQARFRRVARTERLAKESTVEHQVRYRLRMPRRIGNRDRRALRHPEQREARQAAPSHHSRQVIERRSERRDHIRRARHAAATSVIPDQQVTLLEGAERARPERTRTLVLDVVEPARRPHERRPRTGCRERDLDTIPGGAVTDGGAGRSHGKHAVDGLCPQASQPAPRPGNSHS